MVDLKKMKAEWRGKGYTDKEVAQAIGIRPDSLCSKLKGRRTQELSATQLVVICEMLESPLDMFITKDDAQ